MTNAPTAFSVRRPASGSRKWALVRACDGARLLPQTIGTRVEGFGMPVTPDDANDLAPPVSGSADRRNG
jgi:hypothetical protein